MSTKMYLRIGPQGNDEWVGDLKDATADYRAAAEVTQQRLKDEAKLITKLIEIPDPRLLQSKFVICK
jgi:hypothetical protein